MTETYEHDLGLAILLAAVAFVMGWLLPWSRGNGDVTLLLVGTAGAFLTRWFVFGRPSQPAEA